MTLTKFFALCLAVLLLSSCGKDNKAQASQISLNVHNKILLDDIEKESKDLPIEEFNQVDAVIENAKNEQDDRIKMIKLEATRKLIRSLKEPHNASIRDNTLKIKESHENFYHE